MARMQCTYIDLAAAITVWAVDTHSIYYVQKVCIYACSCMYSTSACILSLCIHCKSLTVFTVCLCAIELRT